MKTNMMINVCALLVASLLSMCTSTKETVQAPSDYKAVSIEQLDQKNLSVAYLASGCFWCVEAIFESVEGVSEVVSGYAGGFTKDPTYQSTGTGKTGHSETVAVYYDAKTVSFSTLIDVFYGSQDPTTIGQKPDFGSQYRSIIFYSNDEEKKIAEDKKAAVAASGEYSDPIVTEITAFEKFYEGEAYHQDFERRNPNQRYIIGVSIPRLKRFQAKFPSILKKVSH